MAQRDSHPTVGASVPSRGSNYWQLLGAAADALAVGDYPAAERRYLDACDVRDASPGRVFLTEKIGDGLRRLLRREQTAASAAAPDGRWLRASRDLVQRFCRDGELIVRNGVRLAELRPEDDAEVNQPILETALFLVARSRIFPEETGSAVPLLKGLFRTASRTGRPFSVDLVRHDLPLSEEDRLWLARKGGDLVEAFVEQGHLRQGSPEAAEWAQVFLQLLQSGYFGTTVRLQEERAWLEARTADHLLGRAAASVESYRAYLAVSPAPGPRADEARVRVLELLANTHAVNFAVPRYDEALQAMQSAGLAADSAVAGRFEDAIARVEYRRPESDRTSVRSAAWASAAVEPDGRVALVFWWHNEPRDLAFWTPGTAAETLDDFLAPCDGRLVAADEATLAAACGHWAEDPAAWTAQEFVAAVLESRLPAGGLEKGALLRLALAETGPWRAGWRPGLGHPLLEPPRSSSLVEGWQQGAAAAALQTGLLLLAIRSRIAGADLSLRAGLGEMARRGDPAARFLYDFVTIGGESERALDASFEAWTLPLLWTRPDPFGWSTTGGQTKSAAAVPEATLRPDLGHSDLTIVTTGNAPGVLKAWGDGKQKWRVVLDRMDRLESLAQVAGGVMGPVTLIPAAGRVHSLAAALRLLEELLASPRAGSDGLLGIFHWIRLIETHNGDLLDFRQVRPRPGLAFRLYDRYAELAADLATDLPHLSSDGSLDTETLRSWGGQFSQRVRKAGLVAGTVAQLGTDAHELDSRWGVYEGSDASWVFLDSAAVHWDLHERGEFDIHDLHSLLHTRGSRHLSLLSASGWQRGDLEEVLGGWLRVYGAAYCLSLTDTQSPVLRLVDRGVCPEAVHAAAEELAGQVDWVASRFSEEGAGTILLPSRGRSAEFWRQIRSGELALGDSGWQFLEPQGSAAGLPDAALVVPVLRSLGTQGGPLAKRDTRADWARADAERGAFVAAQRQLCALEIASLLAGHWRSVDILDTRWWRVLRPLAPRTGQGAASLRPWDGEQAALLAAGGTARTFDLPTVAKSSPRGAQIDPRRLEQVNHWLAQRADGPPPPAAAVVPGPGVSLLQGDLLPVWTGLSLHLTQAWERGDLAKWSLWVADAVPAGAAELVAGGGAAGLSVWAGRQAEAAPAPLVWVEPEDLADPALRHLIAHRPPDVIVADDLADWLPSTERDAQETAVALRALLDCGARSVILRASSLTPSWSRFLTGACGAVAAGREPAEVAVDLPIRLAPRCLDCGAADRPAAVAERLRILLARMRSVMANLGLDAGGREGEPLPAVERQLLPLGWLGRLAGLDPGEVHQGVQLLRWAARLKGDSLSAAGDAVGEDEQGGHTVLIARRYAELEAVLARLADQLGLLVPLWMEGARVPGLLVRVDLEHPPARIDPRDLALVDAYLSAVAGTDAGVDGLTYHCPRGLLNSASRLVGWDAPAADLLPALLGGLDLFRDRVRDLFDAAVETGEGFRVETGLTDLRDSERDFLGLGVVLGFWRWQGPAAGGALHLVDLLTVADSPTVKQSSFGWDLFRAQVEAGFRALDAGPRSGPPLRDQDETTGRPRLGQLRRLLTTGLEASDDLDPVVERVHQVSRAPGDPAFLVLKGMLGTGRHEALARGLLRTLHAATDPGEVTIFCPDEAVAAMTAREFLRHGYPGPLDLRVPAHGSAAAGPGALPALADPCGAVVVMCEVQRFEPETRYRVAQAGRGKLLIMTADAVASGEPWEHLFLTTPRADAIVSLQGQRCLGKAIWTEVRSLAPDEQQARAGTRRQTRGHLESGYAANLDQSLARVVAARTDETLPATLRLVTSLPADLEYLGSRLRDQGWLAVDEGHLDALLLPGPRELLATVMDYLQAGREAGAPAAAACLTPSLLGSEARQAWHSWYESQAPAPDLTLAELVGRLVDSPWANTFLRQPEARRRCEELLTAWGREQLGDLPDLPLFAAWRQTMSDDLGVGAAGGRRPLVLLSGTSRLPGCRVPGVAYLCLGTEPVRQHYEFLGRTTDSALVLYQEISPLPRDNTAN